MESWRKVWRTAVVPLLSTESLFALKAALEKDDPRIIQGATTTPPPLQCVSEWDVEAACLLGFCGWIGDGLQTVGEVEEFFDRMCYEIDQTLREPAGCRHLLNWYDDTPRSQMIAGLLPEVVLALAERTRKEGLIEVDSDGQVR